MSVHENHRCAKCGCRRGDHCAASKGPLSGRCPQTKGWGTPAPWPKYPKGPEPKAGQLFDRRIARHWSTHTTFTPI